MLKKISSLLLILACACSEGVAPPKATSIEFVAGASQIGIAGHSLAIVPAFVVKDQNGVAMEGVHATIAVTAGGGTITGAPSATSAGPTPIGSWVLGPRVGTNTITVAVSGLTPATLTIESSPGAPAKFSVTTTTFNGIVGSLVGPGPTATLMDTNDNFIPSTAITVTLTGGGQGPATVTSDAIGNIAVTNWILGTVKGINTLTLAAGAASITFSATAAPGPPSSLSVLSGNNQSILGGAVASPVRVSIIDRFGNGIQDQPVTLSVLSGGGTIANSSTLADVNGIATVTGWTIGRSAIGQALQVAAGAISTTVTATVQTSYNIDVRFFGPPMTADQKAAFTNAAARISGVVVGDVINVSASNLDVSTACGATGIAPLNEVIDDVVIYASVTPIDGVGKILAQGGPCYFRPSAYRYLTAVGTMQFDAADFASISANGTLQDVVTHEMLHVLGIGTFWTINGLLIDKDLPTVAYLGTQARQGCVDSGGVATCASSVPVENTGNPGTAGAHWRESVFGNELMTGYSNLGPNPFSLISVGGLADIGYTINRNGADPFRPGTFNMRSPEWLRAPNEDPWERSLSIPARILKPDGTIEPLIR